MAKRIVYLDYAAATPMADQVLSAIRPYFSNNFFNPSANYSAAKEVKKVVETYRHQTAAIIGSKPSEIIFTAGGTEANNLSLNGIMKNFPKANLIISAIEHPHKLVVLI